MGTPRPGLLPTQEGVQVPRQPDSPGLNASGSQAPTPHPALGGRARLSRSRGPESDSLSVQAPRDEQCEGPRGSEREGGGTAGSRGRGACGSGTGTRGLYRRLRAPQQPFRTARAPPLLFPAAAEAAAAEEAAARPAPPPPAGAIPRRLVGGRARGGRGREQSCALARRLRALPFSACSDAAFLARIFS